MSGLLAYSGIATKVKSMQSKLLSEDKLREMAALENVPEALEYLKRQRHRTAAASFQIPGFH